MQLSTSDNAVVNAVRTELEWDPQVNSAALSVEAVGDAIVLAGVVCSLGEKLAAIEATERVYGVRTVAVEITVMLPTASVEGDARIAEAIAGQLDWNTSVPSTVRAAVEGGVVTLRGAVEWGYERDAAEDTVNLLRGVRQVENLIIVEPSQKFDGGLRERVVEALNRMADLDARTIAVGAHEGTICLQGTVHSVAERRTAQYVATVAPGVRRVDNELAVSPSV